MDAITHALLGGALAGPPGFLSALAADGPLLLLVTYQWMRFGTTTGDIRAGRFPPDDWLSRALLGAHRVAHSHLALLAALLGPIGVAFASHVVLDFLTHERSFPLIVNSRPMTMTRPLSLSGSSVALLWLVLAGIAMARTR